MSRTAQLKLERAAERIAELSDLLREERPFRYILETNTITRERATYAKKNEAVIDRASLIAGDAAHNIRTALDHAWWDIVSPHVDGERALKAVQFPFSETAARLKEAVANRLAKRVSDRFFEAAVNLKPHGEAGGNRLLYLIDQIDIPDKHRTLTPTADYTRVSSDMLRRQIPDAPGFFGQASFGGNRRDIAWPLGNIPKSALGQIVAPTYFMFEKELDVPVEIVFAVRAPDFRGPLISTLNQLIDVAKETINALKLAAR